MKSSSKEAKLSRGFSKSKKWSKDFESDVLSFNENPLPKLNEEGEAMGIITLEDVIEELLQVLKLFLRTHISYSIVRKMFLLIKIFFFSCRKKFTMRQIIVMKINIAKAFLPSNTVKLKSFRRVVSAKS